MRRIKPKLDYYLRQIRNFLFLKFTKLLFLLAFLLLLKLGVNLVSHQYYKPSSITIFFERFFHEYCALFPEIETDFRLKDRVERYAIESRLDDASSTQFQKLLKSSEKNIEILNSYKQHKLSEEELLSARILRYILDESITFGYLYPHFSLKFDHVNGEHIKFMLFMINSHQIENIADADNYLKRLYAYEDKISQILTGYPLQTSHNTPESNSGIVLRSIHQSLDEAIAEGMIHETFIIPPPQILKRMHQQIDFLICPPQHHFLYRDFHAKIGRLQNISEEEKTALLIRIENVLEKSVIPSNIAYKNVIELLQHQPTSENRIPEDFFQFNLVRNLAEEQSELFGKLATDSLIENIDTEIQYWQNALDSCTLETPNEEIMSVHQYIATYQTDSSFYYPSTDSLINDVLSNIKKLSFGEKPILYWNANDLHIDIVPIPKELPIGTVQPHYYPSSLNNTRKGRLYIPAPESYQIPTYKGLVWTLMYFYGDHIRNTRVMNSDLPSFRRIWNTEGFQKGWRYFLLKEFYNMHLFERYQIPEWMIIYEALQNTVAMRIDIGLHLENWDRKTALAFVEQNAFLSKNESILLVDQVLVEPSKFAITLRAYQQIDYWRKEMEIRKGHRYSLKDFLNHLLTNYPIPRKWEASFWEIQN